MIHITEFKTLLETTENFKKQLGSSLPRYLKNYSYNFQQRWELFVQYGQSFLPIQHDYIDFLTSLRNQEFGTSEVYDYFKNLFNAYPYVYVDFTNIEEELSNAGFEINTKDLVVFKFFILDNGYSAVEKITNY